MTAAAGLGVYFTRVGLDNADKLASVIGVFVAVAGLAAAVYGLIAEPKSSDGRQNGPNSPARPSASASASGERSIAIGGDNTGIASTGDGATNTQPR